MISFSVKQRAKDIVLHWATVSETNNLGFENYRQSGNAAAGNDWLCLGLVEGAGTSAELHSYSYIDQDMDAGIYRYRLKQIDTDGKFTFSEPQEIIVALPNTLVLN